MAQTLNCPSCGAPLSGFDPTKTAAECSYCGMVVAIPESMRIIPEPVPQRDFEPVVTVQQVQISFEPAAPPKRRGSGCFGVLSVLISLAITAASFFLITPPEVQNIVQTFVATISNGFSVLLGTSVPRTARPATATVAPVRRTATATAFPTPTFVAVAQVPPGAALSFGGLGTGIGKFEDPRAIAVDSQGTLFVADYTTGRVQRFDESGRWIQSYTIPANNPNSPILCLVADGKGALYVCRDARLVKINVETGGRTATFADPQGAIITDAAIMADGNIATITGSAGKDDIIVFNARGGVVKRFNKAVSTQTNTAQTTLSIAVDGLGNFYVLSGREKAVFSFDKNGKYLDRFGQEGDTERDFYGMVSAIAVESTGRVLVTDWRRIHFFAANGRYASNIPFGAGIGAPMGMAVTTADVAFVVMNSGQVIKYNLNDFRR